MHEYEGKGNPKVSRNIKTLYAKHNVIIPSLGFFNCVPAMFQFLMPLLAIIPSDAGTYYSQINLNCLK